MEFHLIQWLTIEEIVKVKEKRKNHVQNDEQVTRKSFEFFKIVNIVARV